MTAPTTSHQPPPAPLRLPALTMQQEKENREVGPSLSGQRLVRRGHESYPRHPRLGATGSSQDEATDWEMHDCSSR